MEEISQNSSLINRLSYTDWASAHDFHSDTEINPEDNPQELKNSSQMVSALYQQKPNLRINLEVKSGISEVDEQDYGNQLGSSHAEEHLDAGVTKKCNQSFRKAMTPLLKNTKKFELSPTGISKQKILLNRTTNSVRIEIDRSRIEKNNSLSQIQSPLIDSQARSIENNAQHQAALRIQRFF